MGNMMYNNAGIRLPYLCCLLRKQYFLTVVAVITITWTGAGLWRSSSSCSCCYAENAAVAGTAARSGVDGTYLSYTGSVNRSVREEKGAFTAFSHAPGELFGRVFSGLFTYSSPVFVTPAAACVITNANPSADNKPSSSTLPSSGHSDPTQASAPLRLLHAVSNFFVRQGKAHDTAKEAKNDSPVVKTDQQECTGAVSLDSPLTQDRCALTQSGTFYGRMLQAVSELIPRRLFSETGEGDVEEGGFLSRRRPRKGHWTVAPGIGERSQTTEIEAGRQNTGHGVETPSTTYHANAEEQVSTGEKEETTADGGRNTFSTVADYSLGGAGDSGKRRSRRTPLWSLPAFPTSVVDGLSHTISANEASVASSSTSEEVEEEGQQHQQQQESAVREDESDSKQSQQQLPLASPQASNLHQITPEALKPAARMSPAKEPGGRQQLDVPFEEEEEVSAVTETRQSVETQRLSPPEDGLEGTTSPLDDHIAVDSSVNNKDRTKNISRTSGNSNGRRKDSSNNSNGGSRDSGRVATGKTKSSTGGKTSRQKTKNSSNGRGNRGSNSNSRRGLARTNNDSKSVEEGRGEAQLTLQQDEVPWEEYDLNLFPVASSSQFKGHGDFITPSERSSSGSGYRPTGRSTSGRDDEEVGRDSINIDSGSAANARDRTTRNTDTSRSHTRSGTVSDNRPIIRGVSSSTSTPTQDTSSNSVSSVQVQSKTKNSHDHHHHHDATLNKGPNRGGGSNNRSAHREPPMGASRYVFERFVSRPLRWYFTGNTGQTSQRVARAHSTRSNKSDSSSSSGRSSSGRSRSHHKRARSKPEVTLATLREEGGLGSSFAQAVDASGAVIDVLSSSKDLLDSMEAIDLSVFGLPPVQSGSNSNSSGFEKLHSAARAIEEIANWSAAMDQAIDAGKQLGESVSSNIRNLHLTTPLLSPFIAGKPAADISIKDQTGEGGLRAGHAELGDSKTDTKQQFLLGDLKGVAMAALKAASEKAEGFQKVLLAALDKSENRSTNSHSGTSNDSLLQQALNVNDILIAIAGLNASERARSLQRQKQQRSDDEGHPYDGDEVEKHQQKQERTGVGSLLAHAASVKDKIEVLFQTHTHQQGPSNGEYMMPLLRDLYLAARHVFDLLDVSISIADESMDAMQLDKLLRMYQSLIEEGKLAAVGFRSPRVPKRLGQPRVSCANKGMTCCVPAAAAGPDWKQKQQQQLFLQNSPQQECRAVFVSRSSMLCASAPYRNSPCNITHTKTAAMDKYSALLPVPVFSAAALCECEVSRHRNSDGLQKLEGKAEWTAGEIPVDLIEKARKGWQYVKRLSSTGNSLVHLLDHTLGSPEMNFAYGGVPVRRQQQQASSSPQQQKTQEQQQLQEEEELAEKPFSGLADAVTKVLVNQQLLKLLKSDDPAAAVIPPISVSMHLPKKTKSLLLSGLQLPTFLAPPYKTEEIVDKPGQGTFGKKK